MKKSIYSLIFIVLTLISCRSNDDKPFSDADENDGKPAKDSTIVGADKDENGCLASAGYTWSKVNKECVKAFTGIQLNPVDNSNNEDVTLSLYVLFSEDGNFAEVFLPSEKSLILKRESEGKPWIKDDYQLIPYKGYVFKKGDTILYTGDGEVGNKVTGNDKDGDE